VTDPDGWLRYLHVWPEPDIEVIFRLWSADEIVGDVSLFELQGQERLDQLCGILRQIGRTLGKRVAMCAEGAGDYPPMLAYEVDLNRVVLLAGRTIAEVRCLASCASRSWCRAALHCSALGRATATSRHLAKIEIYEPQTRRRGARQAGCRCPGATAPTSEVLCTGVMLARSCPLEYGARPVPMGELA